MPQPDSMSVSELFDCYDALLIDAFGVLVHSEGAFSGAASFVKRLDDERMPYVIITNDASRLPETCAQKYRRDGLDIPVERIVTSGSLVTDYIEDHDLQGARALVLGTRDSKAYAERAGATLVEASDGDFDVLIVGDESGYDFIPAVDEALTTLFHKLDAGDDFHLVLPNPDLIYQRSENSYGFASGSIAALFERALAARYPGEDLSFERLGKPFAPMFEEAVARAGTR